MCTGRHSTNGATLARPIFILIASANTLFPNKVWGSGWIWILGEHYLAHYSDEWSQAFMLPQSDVTFKSFSHMKPSQPCLEAAGVPRSGQGRGHGDNQLRARVGDPWSEANHWLYDLGCALFTTLHHFIVCKMEFSSSCVLHCAEAYIYIPI